MHLRRFAGVAAGLTLLTTAGAACSSDESVFNAEVGECVVNASDLSGNISELPETECTEDHEAEIVALVEHEGDDDDFPGSAALGEEADPECFEEMSDYIGTPLILTDLTFSQIHPSSQSWGEGDRETICIGQLADGGTLDQSLEGNGDEFAVEIDPEFEDLVDSCVDGDDDDCNTLFQETPPGSLEETIGAICGGRNLDATAGGEC